MGGPREREVDVRVIAATGRDLIEDVTAHRFREDLYYRINVVHLHIPPLRARREDIPLLAQHFLKRHSERLGLKAEPLDPEVMAVLVRYVWPGNVRELENVLERALVLSGGAIRVEHLADHVRSSNPPFRLQTSDDDLSVKRRLPALERELIARALERTEGNRTRAAELLELSTRALAYKIQEYELD